MRLLKNITLIGMFFCSLFVFAQEPTKWQMNRANSMASQAAEDNALSEEDRSFVYELFVNQIMSNQKNTKGLSPSEKKVIYQKKNKETTAALTEKFGSQKARSIMKSAQNARKKVDNS
jgi:hypothetical protein